MKDIKPNEIIEVKIIYDMNTDEVVVKSGFENGQFDDPVGSTLRLIEYGLEKWIVERVGLFCPNCEIKIQPEWSLCPSCGWTWREKNE